MSSIAAAVQATRNANQSPDAPTTSWRLADARIRLQQRDFGGREAQSCALYEGDDRQALPHREGAGSPDADLHEAPETGARVCGGITR